MKTQDFRSLAPEAQQAIRMRAVNSVLNGATQVSVAAMFSVSTEAIRQWMRRYEEGGLTALKARKRGRHKKSKLKPWQAATTVRIITDRTPDQIKLPFALWTRDAVDDLIELKFGIRLSRWTVGRYLKRWGFTPQKPAKRALEQNPEDVKRWLETEYPEIKLQAKQDKAEIHWGDEMGIRSDHQTGRTYGSKGKTTVIPSPGKRFGCNMISSITNRGKMRFMVFTERFTADVLLKFLRRLITSADRMVYLIIDRHPVHRARKVERWLEKNKDRIRVFLLPSYSPELNPDEFLNNDVKSNAVGRKRASNKEELLKNVRGYLSSKQRQPLIVRNFFKAKSVRYAA